MTGDRVMPLVKDLAALEQLRSHTPVAFDALAGQLHVLYVEDGPTPMRFLEESELDALGWPREGRPARAWENLARDVKIELHGQGGVVQMLTCGGSYEASLLLYTEFWQAQQGIWVDGGDVVAIVPARDLLIFSWSKIPQGMGRLSTALEECRADPELNDPLDGGPLRFTGSGWVPYEPGPDERPFEPWEPPEPELEEPTLVQLWATGLALSALFVMWAPLGWRFLEIVGLGGGKWAVLACMVPNLLALTAWRRSESEPWHRPRFKRVQLIGLLWSCFCLGLMTLHLGVWEPAKAWWAWPVVAAATLAVVVEARRLALGDGYQWTETLPPDQLRALKLESDA